MKKEKFLPMIITTGFVITFLIFGLTNVHVEAGPYDLVGLTKRGPIRIEDPSDFTSANGVISGTGEFDDPFLISGWEIDGSGRGYGIYIGNITTVSYAIMDNHIHSASGNSGDYNWNAGLIIVNAKSHFIQNNIIEENEGPGLVMMSSSASPSTGNIIRSNGGPGILIHDSILVQFQRNSIQGNEKGIHIKGSQAIYLRYNSISESDSYGLQVEQDSSNVGFNQNNMIKNNPEGYQAYDSGEETTINNNYWHDLKEIYPDAKENAGIYDTPYDIPGGLDRKDFKPSSTPFEENSPEIVDWTEGEPTTGEDIFATADIFDFEYVDSVRVEYWIGSDSNHFVKEMLPGDGIQWRRSMQIPEDAQGAFQYKITAMDLAGNLTEVSGDLGMVMDNDPPMIFDLTSKNTTSGESLVIRAEVVDNIGVSEVMVQYMIGNEVELELPLTKSAGNHWLVEIPSPLDNTPIEYSIIAEDVNGNSVSTETEYVEVLDNDPPTLVYISVDEISPGDTLNLSMHGSTDNTGIANVTWVLEDPQIFIYGWNFSFVFEEPGNYTLNVFVRDSAGNTASSLLSIRVRQHPDMDSDGIMDSLDDDVDGDGFNDSVEIELGFDPTDMMNYPPDMDRDGIPDFLDDNSDGDGISDDMDAFPTDPTESMDLDGDGFGNNADEDDDNDGIPDFWEIFYGLDPGNATDASLDRDGDGITNIDEFEAGTNPSQDETEIKDPEDMSLEDNQSLDFSLTEVLVAAGISALVGGTVGFLSKKGYDHYKNRSDMKIDNDCNDGKTKPSPAQDYNGTRSNRSASVESYKDGNDSHARKRPGRTKYGDITLKKGYVQGGGGVEDAIPAQDYNGTRSNRSSGLDYHDGEDPLTRKIPGRVKYGNITLEKGYAQPEPATSHNASRSNRSSNISSPDGPDLDSHNTTRSNRTSGISEPDPEGGGGNRAQDYNSSRSNNTSAQAPDGDFQDGEDPLTRKRPGRSSLDHSGNSGSDKTGGSRARDYNSSRSNTTAARIDPEKDDLQHLHKENVIHRDIAARDSPGSSQDQGSPGGTRAQDYNSSRSNTTAAKEGPKFDGNDGLHEENIVHRDIASRDVHQHKVPGSKKQGDPDANRYDF